MNATSRRFFQRVRTSLMKLVPLCAWPFFSV